MIINSANAPPTAPPSGVGSGNVPSTRPAAGDPFASLLARMSGGDDATMDPTTHTPRASRPGRKRGVVGAGDLPADMAASMDDAIDATSAAVAVPAWLWAVAEPLNGVAVGFPGSLSGSDVIAAPGSAGSEDSLPLSGTDLAPWSGGVAEPPPGYGSALPSSPANQPVAATVQTDAASLSTRSRSTPGAVATGQGNVAAWAAGRVVSNAAGAGVAAPPGQPGVGPQVDSSTPSIGARGASTAWATEAEPAGNAPFTSTGRTTAPVPPLASSSPSLGVIGPNVVSTVPGSAVDLRKNASLASMQETASPANSVEAVSALSGPNGARIGPIGLGSDLELSTTAAPGTRGGASDLKTLPTTPSTNHIQLTPAAIKTSGIGHAVTGHGEEPGSSADAAAARRDRASVDQAVSANSLAARQPLPDATIRTTNMVRPGERAAGEGAVRSMNLAGADSQSTVAFALMPGAQDGSSRNRSRQDSASAFADPRALADEPGTLATQVLDAPVAAPSPHADHGSTLASSLGVAAGHAPPVEKTTPPLASALPSLFESADRSAAIDDGALRRQMVQAIQLQSRNGIGDARLTLQPEYLGEVTIALRVEAGGVTAHVSAAVADVRAWLGANESLLRQGLLEHGLALDRLIVSDEPAPSPRDTKGGHARQQQQPEPEDQPRPRPRRDTGTFEITI